MARQKFVHFVPRPKPRKRPGRHTKNLNKSKKRSYKKYRGQGRWQKFTNHYIIYVIRKEKMINIINNFYNPNISYKCIRSEAETEIYLGEKSIKKLILK